MRSLNPTAQPHVPEPAGSLQPPDLPREVSSWKPISSRSQKSTGEQNNFWESEGARSAQGNFHSCLAQCEGKLHVLIHSILQDLEACHETEVAQPFVNRTPPRSPPRSPRSITPGAASLNVSMLDLRTKHPCPSSSRCGSPNGEIITEDLDAASVSGGGDDALVVLADVWVDNKDVTTRTITPSSPGKGRKSINRRHQTHQYEIDIFAHTEYASQAWTSMRGWRYQLVNPASMWNVGWRLFAIMLLVLDWLLVPMVVFDLPDDSIVLRVILWVAFLFWTLDMPLSCIRGYVDDDGEIEVKPKRVFRRYLNTLFCQDLVLLVIEWVNFMTTTLSENASRHATGMVRVLKFMRLLKVTKVTTVFNNLVLQVGSVPKVVVVMLLTHHLMACGWQLISGETGPWLDRYVESLLWTVVQLGFSSNDSPPMTFGQSLYALCVSVLCITMMTILVGAVVTEMGRTSTRAKTQSLQESMMHSYLRTNNISWELRNRIWSFLLKSRRGKKFISQKSVDLIRTLPQAITLELEAQTYIPFLTLHPFFGTYAVSGLSSYPMHLIFEQHVVTESSLIVEHELFSAWTPANHMYFPTHGQLYYRASKGSGQRHRSSARGSINLLFSRQNKSAEQMVPTVKEGIMRKLKSFNLMPKLHRQNSNHESGVVLVSRGDWLCEAALWLQWHHRGFAAAKTDCELITIEAQRFQSIMREELPEALSYAKRFRRFAADHERVMDDVFYDINKLMDIAKEVFQPPLIFSIDHCRPTVEGGHSEWHPADRKQWQCVWESAWKEAHVRNTSATISSLTRDMKHDIVLFYQTIFAQSLSKSKHVQLSKEDAVQHDQRALFLKRLVLAMAVCGVQYTTEENGLRTEVWPYPLAAALCHGGRILVHLNEVNWRRFLNTLLFGEEFGWNWEGGRVPTPLYSRHAASHGVRCDPVTGLLQEMRLHGVGALGSNHLGMDLPVGGAGNPAPHTASGQLNIGPAGVPFKKSWMSKDPINNIYPHIQHGHLYIRWDESNFDPPPDGLQVGKTPSRGGSKKVSSVVGAVSSLRKSWATNTGFSWTQNLETWMPASCNRESWTEILPVETTEEMIEILGRSDDQDLGPLHRLWTQDKELCLEKDGNGGLRCRGLLVQLSVTWADGGDEEKHLVQTGATAQPDPASDSSHPASLWVGEACKPTLICPRYESWTSTCSRFFRAVMGLSDTIVPGLLTALQEAQDPYLYRSAPLASVCHRHVSACPSGIDVVYDVLHLSLRLPLEESKVTFDPNVMPSITTRERLSLCGFGQLKDAQALGTVTREFQWVPRQDAEQRGVSLSRPEDSYVLVRKTQATKKMNSLLLGIESSAPMKQDLFGNKHGVDAVSKSTTAFGKRKWRDYALGGAKVPADLGGMHIYVNELSFQRLHQALEAIPLSRPSEGPDAPRLEKELPLFRDLLQSSSEVSATLLEEHLGVDLFRENSGLSRPWTL